MTAQAAAWRELRLLCAEMLTLLESASADTCFDGLHKPARDARVLALSAGVFSRPFIWNIATRKNPGEDRGWFEDWPVLDSLETLRFRAPTGTVSERVVLDARDRDGKPLRAIADRRGWEQARRMVLSILRRRVEHIGGLLMHEAPQTSGEAEGDASDLAEYLAKNPDATEDAALAAVNASLPARAPKWTLDRLRKCDAWKGHFNRRVGAYMDANPDATISQLVEKLEVSRDTIHRSAAYQERKGTRKVRREQRQEAALKAKERERARKHRDALRDFAVSCLTVYQTGGDDLESLRDYLFQCSVSAPKPIYRTWRQYVRRLKASDLAELRARAEQVFEHTAMEALSPEEEDARYKRRMRNARRREDNRG